MGALTTLPVASETGCGNSVTHSWCCDAGLSWCGLDIADEPFCEDDCGCLPCVVCEDMESAPCPFGCNAAWAVAS